MIFLKVHWKSAIDLAKRGIVLNYLFFACRFLEIAL